MLIVFGLLQFQLSVKLYLLLVVLAVALPFCVCVCLTNVLVGCCAEFVEGALFMQGLLRERRVRNQILRPMKV